MTGPLQRPLGLAGATQWGEDTDLFVHSLGHLLTFLGLPRLMARHPPAVPVDRIKERLFVRHLHLRMAGDSDVRDLAVRAIRADRFPCSLHVRDSAVRRRQLVVDRTKRAFAEAPCAWTLFDR